MYRFHKGHSAVVFIVKSDAEVMLAKPSIESPVLLCGVDYCDVLLDDWTPWKTPTNGISWTFWEIKAFFILIFRVHRNHLILRHHWLPWYCFFFDYGSQQPGYKLSSKYLPLCSAEKRNSYRFGIIWGRVRVNPISLSYPFVLPLALVPRNRVVSARGENIPLWNETPLGYGYIIVHRLQLCCYITRGDKCRSQTSKMPSASVCMSIAWVLLVMFLQLLCKSAM